jgi:hypothetical protein
MKNLQRSMGLSRRREKRYAVVIGHLFPWLIDSPILTFYEHAPDYFVGLPHSSLFRTVTTWPRRTQSDVSGLKQTFAN